MLRLMIGLVAWASLLGGFGARAEAGAVKALFSYADWCAPCELLQPKLEAAAADVRGVEIVYIDFTDLSIENQNRQIAKAYPLSFDDFFVNERFVKTGFAYVLVDGESKATISAGMSKADIETVLRAAVSQATGP
ncbi:MAG: thioredoxin family protein [Pseudomonadota bacterium]